MLSGLIYINKLRELDQHNQQFSVACNRLEFAEKYRVAFGWKTFYNHDIYFFPNGMFWIGFMSLCHCAKHKKSPPKGIKDFSWEGKKGKKRHHLSSIIFVSFCDGFNHLHQHCFFVILFLLLHTGSTSRFEKGAENLPPVAVFSFPATHNIFLYSSSFPYRRITCIPDWWKIKRTKPVKYHFHHEMQTHLL